MPDAWVTDWAREVGDLSLFLNTHVAQFVGVELGLEQIGRSTDEEHSETDYGDKYQHGDLLSYLIKRQIFQIDTPPNSTAMDLTDSIERMDK